jgi:hypothetical protein
MNSKVTESTGVAHEHRLVSVGSFCQDVSHVRLAPDPYFMSSWVRVTRLRRVLLEEI